MTVILDHAELEPVFFAPFVSSTMRVEPAWVDRDGRLDTAYYTVLFDRAADEVLALLGSGIEEAVRRRHPYYTAETHVRYLRDLTAGDLVRVTFQLVDCDAQRLHFFERMVHATEGWIAATSETMARHVEPDAPDAPPASLPAPAMIARRLADLKASHARLPRPDEAGRTISIVPSDF